MKKLMLLFIAAGIILSACGNTTAAAGNDDSPESKSGKSATKTVTLDKQDFLTRVMDYENNPEQWKYLGDKPAIIDFYADWCGPCKMVAPILEQLAEEYDGEIIVYKVDTDREVELAALFGIRSIPSLLFIPTEGTPRMTQGVMPKSKFKKEIESFLLKDRK